MQCSDVEPFLASYADDEAPPGDRALLEEHLAACAPCRVYLERERVARDALRAGSQQLRERAPATLRARCERLCSGTAERRAAGLARRAGPVALAIAASLVVAVVWTGRQDAGSGVLAAQLAVDHVKCTKFNSPRVTGSPLQLASYWQEQYGWPIVVPGVYGQDVRLAGIRRCASSEGQTAHLVYTYEGRPVSLFIVRDDQPRTPREFGLFGHEAIVWSANERTYVLVGQEPHHRMQALASTLRKETWTR